VVRKNGGVLEHPNGSILFREANLPLPGGLPDEYGGRTIQVYQGHYGHRGPKNTLLYIVGYNELSHNKRAPPVIKNVANMSKAEREATPLEFCKYLINIASKCCTTVE
jgi:hypothetical protein